MKICAIDVKSGTLRAVEINDKMEMNLLKKATLEDSYNSDEIKSFVDKVEHITDGNFDKIVFKKRADKGKFCASPTSFKIDCIIQLLADCPIEFIAPQAVSAYTKKNTVSYPAKHFKADEDVFKTAWTAMGKELNA